MADPTDIEQGIERVKEHLCAEFAGSYLLAIAKRNYSQTTHTAVLEALHSSFEASWTLCLEHAIEHLLTAMEDAQEILDDAFDKYKDEQLANAAHSLDHAMQKFFSESKITSHEIQ